VVVALGAVPLVGVPETLGWELDGDLGTTTDGDPSD
jgi:hypothetical protein